MGGVFFVWVTDLIIMPYPVHFCIVGDGFPVPLSAPQVRRILAPRIRLWLPLSGELSATPTEG